MVTEDLDAARAHAMRLLEDGHPVLLESYLDGPEVSLFCLVDGPTVVPLLPAQDFKRVGDDDAGPNTGGMGAYARCPGRRRSWSTTSSRGSWRRWPRSWWRRGTPFSGLLYAGLALTSTGPQVVEFNCRFGDPETQVVLPLLRTPLAGLLHAVATGTLAGSPRWSGARAPRSRWSSPPTATRARRGWATWSTGAEGEGVLHAGTRRRDDGAVVSAGGRVLSVVGTGPDLAAARDDAYRRLAGSSSPVAPPRRHRAAGRGGSRRGPDPGLTRPGLASGVDRTVATLAEAARAAIPPFHVMDVWAAAGSGSARTAT